MFKMMMMTMNTKNEYDGANGAAYVDDMIDDDE